MPSKEASGGTTFSVRISNLGCTKMIDGLGGPLYVKIDFDGYKQFSSERVPGPKAGAPGAVQWEQQAAFYYRTKSVLEACAANKRARLRPRPPPSTACPPFRRFRNKLRRKTLNIELWNANTLSSDQLLGATTVDLHTLATGPRRHDLVLREAGKPVGHIVFELEMEELGTDLTVVLSNVRASAPPASFPLPSGADKLTPSVEHCFSLTADRRETSHAAARVLDRSTPLARRCTDHRAAPKQMVVFPC